MLEFNKVKYERVDYNEAKLILEELIKNLKNAANYEKYLSIAKKINRIETHIEEMYDYADIRNMRDLNDDYYKSEIEYWNTFKPQFDLLFLPFYEELNNSKFKDKLIKVMPDNFFKIIEYQIRITSDRNTDLLKRENELKIQYRNLNKTKILYDGEEKTVGSISGLFKDKDRNVRKKAHDAVNDFYYEHREEYTNMLYELVNIRNKIAQNLGFKNYVEYSLYKLKCQFLSPLFLK